MGVGDKRKAYTLANPICMNTAKGEESASRGITKKPFGDIVNVECLILPDSPSLGGLCMEEDFDFHWPRGQKPWLTFPDGSQTELKVVNRVPLWPMNYKKEKDMGPEWLVLQSRVVPQDLGKRLGNRRRRSDKTPDKPKSKNKYS